MAALLLATSAQAAVIGKADFVGVSVSDYEGLGLDFSTDTPLDIDGNTYNTDTDSIRYFSDFGGTVGGTAFGLGTESDSGFIEITLGGSYNQAGLQFGQDAAGTARISFFSGTTLLNSFENTTTGIGGIFYGWDAGADLITRVLVEDLSPTNGRILEIDDLHTGNSAVTAPVPLPAGLPLMLLGLGGLAVMRRKS
ncbi:VPLPA-CTERM sorting domain-containing protein [Primorskyibacter sp. S187A]|uniref:VPLPA-CTERM sorting domain-containing protein n=1 Tax=Primorskyibacter sp. S187A TaxID=3415130 RepID=UPI003C7DCE9A